MCMHTCSKMAESTSSSAGTNLVKKRNTKSPVWIYFGLRATEDGAVMIDGIDRPVCRTCGKAVHAKGGNTTNLYQHLQEHHPALYMEVSPRMKKHEGPNLSTQPTIEASIARSTKYSRDSPQHKDITRAVAYHIGKDGVPIYTVEKPGFKHMIHKLNPRYELPSRKYFSTQAIPTLYTEVRDDIFSVLQNATHYTMTTDLWTSRATEPYITVTIHYVNSEWDLKSVCLDTVALFEDHTAQNIAHSITDILGNLEIDIGKFVAATTNSAANMIAAFRLLELVRISCFGHNLDLAVKKSLTDSKVQRALSRCHSLVNLFSRSWKKSRDLREKQELLDIPQHKLKADVSTRWGSTYEMVSRIIEQQQAICAVLAEDRKNWYNMPKDEELRVLEIIKYVLGNVVYFTDALSGEKEVTASTLRCILSHLHKKLDPKHNDSALAVSMKEIIITDLRNRYKLPEISRVLDCCSFIDPRFKLQYLEDKEGTLSLLKEECYNLYNSDTRLRLSLEPEENSNTSDCSELGPLPPKKRKGLSAILMNIQHENSEATTTLTAEDKIDGEFTSYLDYPTVDFETNPLRWWKDEERRFPTLSILAKKYLSICGTSVPSERIFSTGGYIVNGYRSRLQPKNVNRLIFLSHNLS